MAEVPFDSVEIAEVYFVATLTLAAPTTTELNAGTRLTDFITDGPPSPAGSNFLDAGTLASGFQSQVASTYGGGSGTFTILRKRDTTTNDDSADDGYNALPRGTVGYLVVAAFGNSGATNLFAVGDTVDVYPIEVANRAPNVARGALATGSIDLAFNGIPTQGYELAA